DFGLCTFQKHHKQKILLYLTSMRLYSKSLKKEGYDVCYNELNDIDILSTYESNLARWVQKNDVQKILMFEIEDHFFEERMLKFAESHSLEIQFVNSPMFLMPRQRFVDYLERSKKPFMAKFYQMVREDLNILLDGEGKPQGGKWSFDSDNRDRLPKDHKVLQSILFEPPAEAKKVKVLIEKHFSDHPGEITKSWLPFDRAQALQQFQFFLERKFDSFGQYQDAIDPDEPFLYHSLLSVALNLGWMLPHEVVDQTLDFAEKNKVPLNSVEGFLRQVIGWREFVRGIYHNFSEEMNNSNFFDHNRKMKDCWYSGSTGLPPVDDAIKRAQAFGYNHHIERLMILSNVMLLSQIDPKQVYNWFMEMYVDSSDWVMEANVYGMGQFSEGGIFATKPYISGSNYIRKQSHYPKGAWCDVWDGL
ncbi:MAG: cryptochrome/photolyase family protein, partial [Pseudomonadota bacterium]